MHVGWTRIPLADRVRNVYQIERGVEVVLPTPVLVYEEGEHLVQVEEVRLCVSVGVDVVANVVRIHTLHRIWNTNFPGLLQSYFLLHVRHIMVFTILRVC